MKSSKKQLLLVVALVILTVSPVKASKHRGRLIEILSALHQIERETSRGIVCPSALNSQESHSLKMETARFQLTPLERKDVPALTKILLDEKVADQHLTYLQEYQVAQLVALGLQGERILSFGIWDKNQKLVGMLLLAVWGGVGRPFAEIASYVTPNLWGHSVELETIQAAAKFSFEKLNLHHAEVENTPESLPLEKLGFRKVHEAEVDKPRVKFAHYWVDRENLVTEPLAVELPLAVESPPAVKELAPSPPPEPSDTFEGALVLSPRSFLYGYGNVLTTVVYKCAVPSSYWQGIGTKHETNVVAQATLVHGMKVIGRSTLVDEVVFHRKINIRYLRKNEQGYHVYRAVVTPMSFSLEFEVLINRMPYLSTVIQIQEVLQ